MCNGLSADLQSVVEEKEDGFSVDQKEGGVREMPP